MVKCYLSSIMGDKKLKVSEISRDTGINKNTLHRLYNETATRVDLEMVEQLCRYLNIKMSDLFEIIDEE
jgi:putative transcriptional regulator